jgi:hypothetical protein
MIRERSWNSGKYDTDGTPSMSKKHSSQYFRIQIARLGPTEGARTAKLQEVEEYVVQDLQGKAVTDVTIVHASSSVNTGAPLCGSGRFKRVTMCVDDVTCCSCLLMLSARKSSGAPKADRRSVPAQSPGERHRE